MIDVVNFGQCNFSDDESMLQIKVDTEKFNILEKSLSPIPFIGKKHDAIEYISAYNQNSYTYIKLYTIRFNLCTPETSCCNYISVWNMNIMWCQEFKLYYWTKANKGKW